MGSTAERLIDALPQRPHIRDEDVARWLDAVRRRDPGREVWHTDRLFGIGGSEIGNFVLHSRGAFAFDHPRNIIQSKLLMRAPSPSNPDTERGTDLEPIIGKKFLELSGGTRDTEALRHLENYDGPKRASWMRSNLDDIVVIDGKRYIPDYKAPGPGRAEMYKEKGAPLDYSCQLHQYRMCCEDAGIPIDGLLLVPFSMNEWTPLPLEIAHDPNLDSEIVAVGDHYWNECVLKGFIPPYREPDEDPDPVEIPDELRELAVRFAQARALEEEGKDRAATLKTKMAFMAEHYGLTQRPLTSVGVANFKTDLRTTIDRDRINELLKAQEVDPKKFMKVARREFDHVAAIEEIERLYPDIDSEELVYEKPSLTVSLTRKKKGDEAEMLEIIRSEVRSAASSVLSSDEPAQGEHEEEAAPKETETKPKSSNEPVQQRSTLHQLRGRI
ncbi:MULTISPECIES: YqaJ viral recombinase family protein [unclassified Thioalkalivibrio]|uniref:YqaJ viral recombinase family protein n=1 Tax=unclassified Thioalkalivibrio TaxID=2621013 RepID=UPI001E480603|nr:MULTISPECIES: YqaJ viral recombinase family protein [unclassified Thioalkalivibrio]